VHHHRRPIAMAEINYLDRHPCSRNAIAMGARIKVAGYARKVGLLELGQLLKRTGSNEPCPVIC